MLKKEIKNLKERLEKAEQRDFDLGSLKRSKGNVLFPDDEIDEDSESEKKNTKDVEEIGKTPTKPFEQGDFVETTATLVFPSMTFSPVGEASLTLLQHGVSTEIQQVFFQVTCKYVE